MHEHEKEKMLMLKPSSSIALNQKSDNSASSEKREESFEKKNTQILNENLQIKIKCNCSCHHHHNWNYQKERKIKKCIVSIPSASLNGIRLKNIRIDNYWCLPRAIVVAHEYTKADKDIELYGKKDATFRRKCLGRAQSLSRISQFNKLNQKAKLLMRQCDIPLDRPALLEDISKYEKHLKISICVISCEQNNEVIYSGSNLLNYVENGKVYLYHWKPSISSIFKINIDHFDLIRKLKSFNTSMCLSSRSSIAV